MDGGLLSSGPTRFEISDPNGVFLTLSQDEARMIRDRLRDDDDLSPNMRSMLAQLEEWVDD